MKQDRQISCNIEVNLRRCFSKSLVEDFSPPKATRTRQKMHTKESSIAELFSLTVMDRRLPTILENQRG